MANLKLQTCRAQGSQSYYWRIVDGRDVLARSETMYNKADADNAKSKMKYYTSEYEFEVISTNDRLRPYSWHAKAKNSRLVVASTTRYGTYADAHRATEYVRIDAPYADLEYLTY